MQNWTVQLTCQTEIQTQTAEISPQSTIKSTAISQSCYPFGVMMRYYVWHFPALGIQDPTKMNCGKTVVAEATPQRSLLVSAGFSFYIVPTDFICSLTVVGEDLP